MGDVYDTENVAREACELGQCRAFDVLTSDLAPATTGQTGVDQYRSVELNLALLELAKHTLKPGGAFVAKTFVGEDFNDFFFPIKEYFSRATRFKPHACRDRSFEEYVIGIGFRSNGRN